MNGVLPNDGTSEHQYLDLLRDIELNGDFRGDRTGVGTYAVHGRTMRFSLADGVIPLLTTKRVPFKAVFFELCWFLRGQTNIRPLLENKVTIWSEWPHAAYVKASGDSLSVKEFEQRILADESFAEQWGSIGPGYGKQWRRWEGPDGKVYDQVADVLARLRRDPYSRRILFHGWNVAEVDQMALPPCHLLYQFFVAQGKLSLTLYQRSCDTALGVPFNIASAALLVHLIANQVGLEPGELFWVGHDVHLYQNHIAPLKEQLTRTPKPFPRIVIHRKADDLHMYEAQDIELVGYDPDPAIKMEVAV